MTPACIRGARKLFVVCLIVLLTLWCYIASNVISSSALKNGEGSEALTPFLGLNASLNGGSGAGHHLRHTPSLIDSSDSSDLRDFHLAAKKSEDLLLLQEKESQSVRTQVPSPSPAPSLNLTLVDDTVPLASPPSLTTSSTSYYTGIDVVYTWVNDLDPVWLEQLRDAVGAEDPDNEKAYGIDDSRVTNGNDALPQRRESRFEARRNKFREWGELRYSMRSFLTHAGHWLRQFILVTANAAQVPTWLNTSHPRIRIVHHAELFDDPARQLPTFNSLAIESVLHRIPGLSERFLYANNDLFLSKRVEAEEFWDGPRGIYYSYTDWEINFPTSCSAYFDEGATAQIPAVYPTLVTYKKDCAGTAFVWDAILARWAWSHRLKYWSAHMPHLWQISALRRVEETLAPYFLVSRRNKMRDARTDIAMHVQYEAYIAHSIRERESAANFFQREPLAALPGDAETATAQRDPLGVPPGAPERATSLTTADPTFLVRRGMGGHASYVYVIFDNKRPEEASNNVSYTRLAEKVLKADVKFIGIEDDTYRPTSREIAYHRERLEDLFTLIAPVPAPWEYGY